MQRFVYLFARLGKRGSCVAVPCSGFTLIELLVVVMIIGILSAVALPQYTKAVNKSRYAGLMPLAKSVKQAEEAVYMANAAYTNNLSDLAVGLPSEVNNGGDIGVTVGSDGSKSYVRAVNTKIGNAYVMYFDKSGTYPKEIHCEAKSGDNRAKELCLNMGAVSENTATSTTSGYDAYVLEGEVPSGGGGSESTNTTVDVHSATENRNTTWECETTEECGKTGCSSRTDCSGVDSTGLEYEIQCSGSSCTPDNSDITEWWTETDGDITIEYGAVCASMDENYRCTEYAPGWDRWWRTGSSDDTEIFSETCVEGSGLVCSNWVNSDEL